MAPGRTGAMGIPSWRVSSCPNHGALSAKSVPSGATTTMISTRVSAATTRTTRDVGGSRTSCHPYGRLSLAVRGVSHEAPLVGRTRHSTTGRRRGLAAGKVRLNFLFTRNR